MSGNKFDQGKPRVSLVMMSRALLEVAKVGTMGAEKYGDHNFRDGMEWSRIVDADLRHLLEFLSGNRIDDESKLTHLAHHAWNALTLLEYELNNVGTDDLFKGYKKDLTEELKPDSITEGYLIEEGRFINICKCIMCKEEEKSSASAKG